MKKLIIGVALTFALVSPAMAGKATLKKDGKTYALTCENAGCFISEKVSMFKSGPKKKLGPGGSANFKKWHAKFKADGYK